MEESDVPESLDSQINETSSIGDTNTDGEPSQKDVHVTSALNLSWSFGVNKNVPVLNLSSNSRKKIFYATSHTGVLYDCIKNKQTLFQGHENEISCTCVSEDKRWLATADIGRNNMVIIWDAEAGIPIQTLFDVHPDGVECMAISNDAKFIVTASHSVPQVVAVWDWTTEKTSPICVTTLEEQHGLQTRIAFHDGDSQQIVSNNGYQVVFYHWKEDEMSFVAPPLTDKDFNKAVGLFSQSVFLPGTDRALTCTSCGNIVVWSQEGELLCNKKAFKIVKIQEKSLTVLTLCGSYIATGDVTGNVKFFDFDLKLSNWYQQFQKAGPINAISFSYSTESNDNETPLKRNAYPSSSTLAAVPFVINNMVIGTTKSNILFFQSAGSNVEYVREENEKAVHAIACHPKEPRICIGGYTGLLQLWNYDRKVLMKSRNFGKDQEITCLTFSPQGDFIATGFSSGRITVIDGLTLQNEGEEDTKCDFYHCLDSISKVAFSYDCRYLASSDDDYCVTLFKAQLENKSQPWVYIGKQRAHYKRIVGITFGKALDEERPRLFSLGEDRVMVEYDIENSTEDDLRLVASDRIEQSAVPTCFAWYPPIIKEDFLLVVNDQFKIKLLNSTTKMCRKTLLGPTYGSTIKRVAILPPSAAHGKKEVGYMAYVTTDKIGLQILPIDGNPHKSMALIAHPSKVHDLACSYNGKYVFTAGGSDCSVLMWEVNTVALNAIACLGGEGLIPFYGLLDGGREGELFADLEEYFYYSQMRSQGVDSTDQREVSTLVPISEIPFIMRALGFYPTEQEIDDMLNEVKFSKYVESGTYVTDIGLGDFIKLYVNHRPVFGLSPENLQEAFNTLGEPNENGESAIDRGHLLYLLQNKGEHLTEAELAEYMSTLLGFAETSGTAESHSFDAKEASNLLQDNLPKDITAEVFAGEMLGLIQ
eukprot:gene14238-15723_t